MPYQLLEVPQCAKRPKTGLSNENEETIMIPFKIYQSNYSKECEKKRQWPNLRYDYIYLEAR